MLWFNFYHGTICFSVWYVMYYNAYETKENTELYQA